MYGNWAIVEKPNVDGKEVKRKEEEKGESKKRKDNINNDFETIKRQKMEKYKK